MRQRKAIKKNHAMRIPCYNYCDEAIITVNKDNLGVLRNETYNSHELFTDTYIIYRDFASWLRDPGSVEN